MIEVFDAHKVSARFEIRNDSLSCLIAIHACVLGISVRDLCVFREADLHGKTVTATDLKVVGVVSGSDLYATRSLFGIGVLVTNDRNTASNQRKHAVTADKILVALVVGVYGNSRIAQKRFGTCCCNLKISAATDERILNVPEVSLLLLIGNLCVGNRRLAVRTPVDNTLTAVDKSLVVKTNKDLLYRIRAALVKSEALAGPVAGGAHLLQLGDDASAVLLFPCPSALQELFASQIALCQALFSHGLNDLRLSSDRRVVSTGKPESAKSLHSLVTDKNVLKSVVKGVAHVKLSGDVRRGDYY